MTEAEMRQEAQLVAISHVLQNLLASFYLAHGFSEAQIVAAHKGASDRLNSETLPGADPVQADMLLSEIEEAVSDLQAAALSIWKDKRKKAGFLD